MKRFLFLLIGCSALAGCSKPIPSDGELAVVPRPEYVAPGDGVFELKPSTPVILLFDDPQAVYAADALNEIVAPVFGRKLNVATKYETAPGGIHIAKDPSLAADAYRLTVCPTQIDMIAGGPSGAFYAVQTLRQLMPLAAFEAEKVSGMEIPSVIVEDKPCLGYRGLMLDVSRHFFTVEEVKGMLDLLAMHKMNVFHWHLTDDQGWRIEIKKYPELTRVGSVRKQTIMDRDAGAPESEVIYDRKPYGGYYTQEQIREVVDYAARRFITVIPEIEFPGHSVAALASYPWLGCTGEPCEVWQRWGVDDRVCCIGRETTFEFIEDVLGEVLELFPSEYIHIGGDECPVTRWQKCPHCRARMKAERLTNARGLQGYATARVERFLQAHGRKLIGWDEILDGGVSPTAAVMSWRSTDGGIRAAKYGNYAVMAPCEYCYFSRYQSDNTAIEPLAGGGCVSVENVYEFDPYKGLTAQQRPFILGVQACLWTEHIADNRHAQYMLLPRLSALAEVGWSLDRKDYADYLRRVHRLARYYRAGGYNYAQHIFRY